MNHLRNRVLLFLLLGLGACSPDARQVRVENRKSAQGNAYTLFYPQNLAIQVTTHRPSAENSRYQLSVAAAYTDLETYRPLDLLVDSGRVLQPKAKVGFLDGVLTLVGANLTISHIPGGQSPAPAQVEQVRRQQGTLLLQELLVFESKSQKGPGGSVFQRRALAEFSGHRFAVVESASDYLTMKQFGDDLVELGAKNALYLDMGDWDEGWYRAGRRVVVLGNRRTQTARQSNWLVFVKQP